MDVDRATLETGPRGGATPSRRDGVLLDEGSDLGRGVVGGHDPQQLTVEAEDERSHGVAELHRVLRQRLEHWLEIEGGAPDHPEELARRRLLLEGHAELAVAGSQLRKETHVLDGDD